MQTHILQEWVDRIIDILDKEKIVNLFFFKYLNLRPYLYMFQLFCYIVLRRLVR